jgi:hypothetical protein
VTVGARSNRTIVDTAFATTNGSSASSTGATKNPSETALKSNNASTSDGDISIAGAIAVGVDIGTTSAFVNNATIGHIGTSGVTIAATPVGVGSYLTATAPKSTATGVAVAVSINVADRDNLAYVTAAHDHLWRR